MIKVALPAFTRKLPVFGVALAVVVFKPELLVGGLLALAVVGIMGGLVYVALYTRDPERRKTAVELFKAIFTRKS